MTINQNQKVIQDFYKTLNQNDIAGAMELFDPRIERIELLGLPSEGPYHGLAEMEAHLRKGRGTWAEGSCRPERFIECNDKVVVYVYVHVRLKNQADWLEGRVTDAFTLSNGKIIEFRSYSDGEAALKWAGCDSSL